MSRTETQDPNEPSGAKDPPEIALSPRSERLYAAWLEATERTALPEDQLAEFIRKADGPLLVLGFYTYRELVEAGRRARTRSSSGTAYILRLGAWVEELESRHTSSPPPSARHDAGGRSLVEQQALSYPGYESVHHPRRHTI